MSFFKSNILFIILGGIFISSCDIKANNTITPKDLNNNKNITTPNTNPALVGNFDIKKTVELVTNKCTYCHSLTPKNDSGYTSAPKGITFDTQKEIENQMDIIKKVTFINKSMPIGKITMTDEERNIIGLFGNQSQVSEKLEIKNVPDLITRKCSYCHATVPDKSSGYSSAADGFRLDSLQDMINKSQKIKKETLIKRSMPIHPISITEEERQMIGQWVDQQKGSSGNIINNDDDD